eukprot:gnl/MRDRNA2_/MRDRNA2_423765_c0_seq1.p1 gnl/MRDRNA2_/MRDRNA2_423765_c0~~gnl/MRDRNA2_/MRDRNA2_423765_c0_seq1.p1  ORF type:complete len:121 (-),score=23.43 gnl/MRDRNA2_/MRDRNA2_423765_c0_seq1:80-442(-)
MNHECQDEISSVGKASFRALLCLLATYGVDAALTSVVALTYADEVTEMLCLSLESALWGNMTPRVVGLNTPLALKSLSSGDAVPWGQRKLVRPRVPGLGLRIHWMKSLKPLLIMQDAQNQ